MRVLRCFPRVAPGIWTNGPWIEKTVTSLGFHHCHGSSFPLNTNICNEMGMLHLLNIRVGNTYPSTLRLRLLYWPAPRVVSRWRLHWRHIAPERSRAAWRRRPAARAQPTTRSGSLTTQCRRARNCPPGKLHQYQLSFKIRKRWPSSINLNTFLSYMK